LDSFCLQNVQPALALAIVVLACILVHLILIHRSQHGAVSSASDNHVALADVVLKNFVLIPSYAIVLLPLALVLIHPDS